MKKVLISIVFLLALTTGLSAKGKKGGGSGGGTPPPDPITQRCNQLGQPCWYHVCVHNNEGTPQNCCNLKMGEAAWDVQTQTCNGTQGQSPY